MSNASEVGNRLVELCSKGENMKAIQELYSDDIVSVEACEMGDMPRTLEGIDAVKGKNEWWMENHEVHSGEAQGPYPHGEDRFALTFSYDVTNKPSGNRMQMNEVGVFTVADGKIVKEEFFYQMG